MKHGVAGPRNIQRCYNALWLSCGVGAVAIALSNPQAAYAQSCPGMAGDICDINVTQHNDTVETEGATRIVNEGTGTSIVQTSTDYLLVENASGATIDGVYFSTVPAAPRLFGLSGNTVVNAGIINGDLIYANGGVYVDEGGTVTGSLRTRFGDAPLGINFGAGFTTEVYVDRADGGTLMDPGNGIDFFVKSYSGAGAYTHSLSSTLPTHFEVGGVEALGSDVLVTIQNEVPGQANQGLLIVGNGSIVNRAIINNASALGSGLPDASASAFVLRAVTYGGEIGRNGKLYTTDYDDALQPYTIELNYGGALKSFSNEGTINGDVLVSAATFDNSGEINLHSNEPGTLIQSAAGEDFVFTNSGDIRMTAQGKRTKPVTEAAVTIFTAFDATTANGVNIANSGEIEGGLLFQGFASDFIFNNEGTINRENNPNGLDLAVEIEVTGFDFDFDKSLLPSQWLLSRDEVVADSGTITNSGTIDGGLAVDMVTKRFSFVNSGAILSGEDAFEDALELSIEGDSTGKDVELARFENIGSIAGRTELEFAASDVEFVNTGNMRQEKIATVDLYAGRRAALEMDVETTLGATVNFENAGEISTADYAAGAVVISVLASEGVDDGVPGAELTTATVNVVNSGLIRASGGNYVTPGIYLPDMAPNQLSLDLASGLAVLADGEGGSTITIRNDATGIINARGDVHTGTPTGTTTPANQSPTAGGIAVAAVAENVTITNAGRIIGSDGGAPLGNLIPADRVMDLPTTLDFEDVMGGAIDTFRGVDFVTNEATGIIEGGIALRSGDDTLANYGTITGNIYLGNGDDRFIQGIGATFNGTADGGAGQDTFLIDVTGGGTIDRGIYDQLVNFEVLGLTGSGAIEVDGILPFQTLQLSDNAVEFIAGSEVETEGAVAITGTSGNNNVTNRGTITGAIDLGAGNDTLNNTGSIIGDINLGDGDDRLVFGALATFDGIATGGAGYDTLQLESGGKVTLNQAFGSQFSGFELLHLANANALDADGLLPFQSIQIATGAFEVWQGSVVETQGSVAILGTDGVNDITNRGTINGDIDLGAGNDTLSNYGTIAGNLYFGDGNDRFIQGINASFTGIADGGAGEDTFLIDITGGGKINDALYTQLVNFEILGLVGSGEIEADGPLPVDTVELGGSMPIEFADGAVIETQGPTAVTGTNEANVLINRGTINGDVDLGGGNDELILAGNWAINGTVSGGEGVDRLAMSLLGTPSEPTELDLGQFESFEQLALNGGTGAVSDSISFEQIDVNGGYLFGRPGSTITGDVNVGPAGTFGSAGTVNGDVQVAGTLSPGASPGTLTINGNVTLEGSSVTVFEMTPTVSDAIVINGRLEVEQGAKLNITGERPLTPGVAYDLITASGGIDGQFIIDKAETVLGFITQTQNALQLLGTFQLGAGASAQSSRTTSYLNSLLVAGTAPSGVMAAVPALLRTDGFANEAALVSISPEAYASATQIGIESGLAISSALRSASFAGGRSDGGLFAFGQGFGQWRNFAADHGAGIAQANLRTAGVLSGVGFGNSTFSVAGFVGYVDARQHLSGRSAVTKVDGVFAGATLALNTGGLRAGASAIWDGSDAETSRTLFNGNKTQDAYSLRSVTLDAFMGYAVELGGGWEIGPEVGVTHVSVKRGDVSETGGGAFALELSGQRYNTTFINGDLVLSGTIDSVWRPYLSAGVRHELDGDPIVVSGGLVGAPGGLIANGAVRKGTIGRVGGGVALQISPGASLFARGESEFGSHNNARTINAGLRLNF